MRPAVVVERLQLTPVKEEAVAWLRARDSVHALTTDGEQWRGRRDVEDVGRGVWIVSRLLGDV